MKRYSVTSPKYAGEVELLYNDSGTLAKIDFTQTDMDPFKVSKFKSLVPATESDLPEAFINTNVTVVAAEYAITFELFYKDYPMKRNPLRAKSVFDRLSKTDQVKAYVNLSAYIKYLRRNTWLSPKMAEKYLRDREFENDWSKL